MIRLLADGDIKLRTAQHKVQVLIRSEVHWLLACPTSLKEYEESIVAHLGQVKSLIMESVVQPHLMS